MNSLNRLALGVALAGFAGTSALVAGQSARAVNAVSSATTVTFTEDVAPTIFNNCTSCHRPGEMGPFSLTSYDDVRPRARRIVDVTKAHQMPPWKAAPSDFAFKGDRTLSAKDIDTLDRW